MVVSSFGAGGVTLQRIVEILGPSVLRVLETPGLEGVCAADVVVHDVVDPPVLRPGDVLLGVGLLATSGETCKIMEAAGGAGAAAVVVRSGTGELPLLRAAAVANGVTLMILPTAMRWEQISVLMRHAIAAGYPDSGGATAMGDLFGFANALAKAVGGAITIEDPTNQVLAYSTSHEDELDAPRREAILGRRVPEAYLKHIRDSGVFAALRTSEKVVHLDADGPLGLRRRLAVAVRANGEMLGSLWALEGHVELGPVAESVLQDASRIASGHLIRAQSTGLTLRQRREDLLKQLLEDGAGASSAADGLGFDPDLPGAVLGITLDSKGSLGADHHAYRRLGELLNARAMAYRWIVATVFSGVRLLVLLPELTSGDGDRLEVGIKRLASGLAQDAELAGLRVRVACGPVVGRLADAAATTAVVDEILHCLAREPGRGPVATYEEVHAAVSVNKAVMALGPMTGLWEGPVARLLEHDRSHRSDYHVTLRAWLDSFGDTADAARSLNIHPNTVRYRLQRIIEVSGIRLDDPEERLMAGLHLRLVAAT